MGKREQEQCLRHKAALRQAQTRLDELVERGEGALSRYDVEVAAGGDSERALWTALYLVGNQTRYFTEKVAECDQIPRQATLFEAASAAEPIPNPSLPAPILRPHDDA